MGDIAHHPSVSGWDNHPLEKPLIAHLQQKLPADVYAAVWEHGKSLDWDAVVIEIASDKRALYVKICRDRRNGRNISQYWLIGCLPAVTCRDCSRGLAVHGLKLVF